VLVYPLSLQGEYLKTDLVNKFPLGDLGVKNKYRNIKLYTIPIFS